MLLVQTIFALLIYPGLMFALLLGVFYETLTLGRFQRERLAGYLALLRRPQSWTNEQAMNILSILLASLGLLLLPWPLHPVTPPPVLWLWSWGALEAAFLLPLLPAMLVGSPLLARAAVRTAQIGVAGRSLLWLAMVVSLLLHNNWQLVGANGHSPALAHGLAALAAVFAFPLAIGWGSYDAETSLNPDGVDSGLDQATRELAQFARTVCTAVLLAAALLALLPVGLLVAPVALLLWLSIFIAASTPLKLLSGYYPRHTLPGALRRCMWRALPAGAAAVVYLALVAGW
jgi:hypothetical protein